MFKRKNSLMNFICLAFLRFSLLAFSLKLFYFFLIYISLPDNSFEILSKVLKNNIKVFLLARTKNPVINITGFFWVYGPLLFGQLNKKSLNLCEATLLTTGP